MMLRLSSHWVIYAGMSGRRPVVGIDWIAHFTPRHYDGLPWSVYQVSRSLKDTPGGFRFVGQVWAGSACFGMRWWETVGMVARRYQRNCARDLARRA